MNIHKKSSNRIIIELSQDDMKNYNITFDKMNAFDLSTQNIINDMCRIADINSNDTKTVIDALPSDDGGCILLITALPTSKQLKATNYGYICSFENIDNAFAFSKVTKDKALKAKLYSNGNMFYLLISADKSLLPFLSEFGEIATADRVAVAYLNEHCKKISDNIIPKPFS